MVAVTLATASSEVDWHCPSLKEGVKSMAWRMGIAMTASAQGRRTLFRGSPSATRRSVQHHSEDLLVQNLLKTINHFHQYVTRKPWWQVYNIKGRMVATDTESGFGAFHDF